MAHDTSAAAHSEAHGIIEQFDKLYEFDREPVAPDRLLPGRHFAGLFAGEHVAGTEFVIGALFVSWGVTARDLFLGLLVGNALAVASWALVCCPIATQTRLTLYWYLRRIAGPVVTAIYNVLNAIMFCILSGAMITVSASAVRIPLGIPPQTKWYPEDGRFVVLVLLLGAVVIGLAILGFKRLAQFSSVCSPWIFSMFFAGAVATIPLLAAHTPGVGRVENLSDFWRLAETAIWTGRSSASGAAFGFWHVVSFAWICNLAMHIGLSDMAQFRYARKSWYGIFSACGMYLGHYLAWVSAGIMGAATAVMMSTPLKELDAGAIAFTSLGAAGALAVILAGWTTANPTLYRAGLAFQAVTPGWPRWLVTMLAGVLTTLVACCPFVFTSLLQFVAMYGILLMPVGAVVLAEHWIFPRIGLTQYWSSRRGDLVNVPALVAWMTAIAASVYLYWSGTMHEFYLGAPIWLLTVVVYILLAAMTGARTPVAAGTAPKDERRGVAMSAGAAAAAQTAHEKWEGGRALLWISGLIALATFALCLALPLNLLWQGSENFTERLAALKTRLIMLSLMHLAAATVWNIIKDRRAGID